MLPVKGTNGYIQKRKLFQIIMLLVTVVVSVGLFLCGYFSTGSSKNLLTVIAMLGVLPAAKCIVNLVLFLPYRSLDAGMYREFSETAGETGKLYSDLVFTSQKRVMHLDALYINGTEIAALLTEESKKPGSSSRDKSEKEIGVYVTETMKKRAVSVHMHIFNSGDAFRERIASLSGKNDTIPEELAEFWQVVLV